MQSVAYYILPSGSGWRVVSRSFVWDFRSRDEATGFALACARNYADAAGLATTVRVQDEHGVFHELCGHPGFDQRRASPAPRDGR